MCQAVCNKNMVIKNTDVVPTLLDLAIQKERWNLNEQLYIVMAMEKTLRYSGKQIMESESHCWGNGVSVYSYLI